MSSLIIENTNIEGLQTIQRNPVGDERGYFERLFCVQELKTLLGRRSIVQINHSLTDKIGSVRGMHFQHPPHDEMKLVACLSGEVFDVAIDLRRGSPTFLEWHSEILSEKNHRTLCIPEGFAHGFQSLTAGCKLIYLHTAAYEIKAEAGLNVLDPSLAINWPLPITECSVRDQGHAPLQSDFLGLSP